MRRYNVYLDKLASLKAIDIQVRGERGEERKGRGVVPSSCFYSTAGESEPDTS